MDTTVLDVDTSRDRIVDLTDRRARVLPRRVVTGCSTCSRRTPPRASRSSRPARAPTTTSSTRSSACSRATTGTATRTARPVTAPTTCCPRSSRPPSCVPVQDGEPLLGVWQSVVLVDLNRDNPRRHVRLSFVAG